MGSMEPLRKRIKTNNSRQEQNAHHTIPHEYAEASQVEGQGSVQHHGEGVQVAHGEFNNGRDLIMSHNYGTNNNHFYSTTATTATTATQSTNATISKEEGRSNLLESLKFSQIDARRENIKKAHIKTCKWLLQTPQYLEWLDTSRFGDHNGLLWIKGKPGAGKSTLMKFVYKESLKTRGKVVISFFFHARGEELEKSTTGLYRSLLLQLFEARPDVKYILDSIRPGHRWTIESLKSLFEETIQAMGETSLICFIDALDECEEHQIRDMISFLQDTSAEAFSLGTRFHVCFASRYYPNIVIEKGLTMAVEEREEHQQDIIEYLNARLRIGNDDLAQEIRTTVREKALGIFMWVVLVVDILNIEYGRGRKHSLKKMLQQIPDDLHELFHNILTRDNKNADGLLLCIQWVLFATRPLTPSELYFAIMSGVEPECLSDCHVGQGVSIEDIHRYILDNSKGLAESTKSRTPTVQFIHESVRDFLLKDNGLQKIWPNLEPNIQGQSHEQLLECCHNYMRNEFVLGFNLRNNLEMTVIEAKDMRDDVANRLPFLEYASQNVLRHANEAEKYKISQKDFMSAFLLEDWITCNNIFEKHKIRRYKPNTTLLYILADRNLPELIRIQDSGQSCIAAESSRYGTPLYAALATQSYDAAQALFEIQLPPCSSLEGLSERLATSERIANAFGRRFEFSRNENIFHYVVLHEINVILENLLLMKDIVYYLNGYGQTALATASRMGNIFAVEKLLGANVDVNEEARGSQTPLKSAIASRNESIVQLLLERGANVDVNEEARGSQTPLELAIASKNESIVQLLLERGANSKATTSSGESMLHIAIDGGNSLIVNLLVEKGADLETTNNEKMSPLYLAVYNGHRDIVSILLEKGANIENSGNSGKRPLHSAARMGRTSRRSCFPMDSDFKRRSRTGPSFQCDASSIEEYDDITRLLLDSGADIEGRDSKGYTPLASAILAGCWHIAKILLDRGAKVESIGRGITYDDDLEIERMLGMTPLMNAAASGNDQMVRLLLDLNADINESVEGMAALPIAAANGYTSTVELLINRGADINGQRVWGKTSLMIATMYNYVDIVQLLLSRGADINLKNRDSRDAFTFARKCSCVPIAQLLNDGSTEFNVKSTRLQRALAFRSQCRCGTVGRLLLENGAEIEWENGAEIEWAACGLGGRDSFYGGYPD